MCRTVTRAQARLRPPPPRAKQRTRGGARTASTSHTATQPCVLPSANRRRAGSRLQRRNQRLLAGMCHSLSSVGSAAGRLAAAAGAAGRRPPLPEAGAERGERVEPRAAATGPDEARPEVAELGAAAPGVAAEKGVQGGEEEEEEAGCHDGRCPSRGGGVHRTARSSVPRVSNSWPTQRTQST